MKILIVGAKINFESNDKTSVLSYEWKDVRKIKGFGDFDRVVLQCDTLPLPLENDVFGVCDLLSMQNIARVALHDGHIVVMGDFTKEFIKPKGGSVSQSQFTVTSVGDLLRLGIGLEENPGNNSRHASYPDIPETLRPYLNFARQIDSWDTTLTALHPALEQYKQAMSTQRRNLSEGWEFGFKVVDLLQNRHGSGVARAIVPTLITRDPIAGYISGNDQILTELGAILFLGTLAGGADQTLTTLLDSVWNLQTHTPVPDWIENAVAPGQAHIDDQIRTKREQINRLTESLDTLLASREHIRLALRLLYSKGIDLEEAVASAFQTLGAEIINLEASNRTDLLLAVTLERRKVHLAVETKGTARNTFDENGLRQLDQWTMDCMDLVNDNVKGVFVGNSEIEYPTECRASPFGANFLKRATARNYAVLPTQDLFRLLDMRHEGTLLSESFFSALFNTDGLLRIDDLRK